jgi:hypothetical protein
MINRAFILSSRIQSSKKKPDGSFVTINYRNTWFWIDDATSIPSEPSRNRCSFSP